MVDLHPSVQERLEHSSLGLARLGEGARESQDRAVVFPDLERPAGLWGGLRHVPSLGPDAGELSDPVPQPGEIEARAMSVLQLVGPLLKELDDPGTAEAALDELERTEGHLRVALGKQGGGPIGEPEGDSRASYVSGPVRPLDKPFRLEGSEVAQDRGLGEFDLLGDLPEGSAGASLEEREELTLRR